MFNKPLAVDFVETNDVNENQIEMLERNPLSAKKYF